MSPKLGLCHISLLSSTGHNFTVFTEQCTPSTMPALPHYLDIPFLTMVINWPARLHSLFILTMPLVYFKIYLIKLLFPIRFLPLFGGGASVSSFPPLTYFIWAINKLALIICPSKNYITFYLHLFMYNPSWRPLTTNISMFTYCPSYISMVAYFLHLSITAYFHAFQYVRILHTHQLGLFA